MTFARYAIYYCPPAGADWAQFCARWLGWDMLNGAALAHPNLENLPLPVSEITQTPRKYGLHATLKPPFHLAAGKTQSDLERACAALADDQTPLRLPGLKLARMGRFLALRPDGPTELLNSFAARCVRDLDMFRAPPTSSELAQRRGSGLSREREHNLLRWGYPHVLELYRFHITLTGRLPNDILPEVERSLAEMLNPLLPGSVSISDLALVGEDDTGQFQLIQCYPLNG